MTVTMQEICGSFAENKDQAKELRENFIKPALARKTRVILDFTGVDSSTQSFIHALISAVFQEHGERTLEKITFKGCNKALQSLITTVINYSLE